MTAMHSITMKTLLPVGLLVVFSALCCAPAPAETIAQVKKLPDWTEVVVEGCISVVETLSDCYIQDVNRSAGIWVHGAVAGLYPGQVVTVTGMMNTINDERFIDGANLYPTGETALVKPLGMANRWVGAAPSEVFSWWPPGQQGPYDYKLVEDYQGNMQWQWRFARGVCGTGLLVTTWGVVTGCCYSPTTGTHWFYVDDGYEATADYSNRGVLVYSEKPVAEGDYVAVTGAACIDRAADAARAIRAIRARSFADVAVLRQAPEREYPFSDEFDKRRLDPRWVPIANAGAVSAASNPGWLKLVMPDVPRSGSYPAGYGPEVLQRVSGDWDLETRLHGDFSDSATVTQWVAVRFRDKLAFTWSQDPALYLVSMGISPTRGRYVKLGPTIVPRDSDTVWARVRKRGLSISAGISFDGYTYQDYSVSSTAGTQVLLSVAILSADPAPSERPFAAYVDYFRIGPELW